MKRRPAHGLWDPHTTPWGGPALQSCPLSGALGLPITLKRGLGVVREGVSPAHLEKDRDVFCNEATHSKHPLEARPQLHAPAGQKVTHDSQRLSV